MSDKPAILQDSEFTVEEGFLYKACRTGAIWMNKLFFSSATLLVIWLFYAYFAGVQDCSVGLGEAGGNATQDLDSVAQGSCSVFLTTTAKYLGAMTILSFLASLGLGALGLVVGKNILEVKRADDEPGAPHDDEE